MPRFKACHPDSQKCVSTLNDTGYPAMEPVPFTCSPQEALAAVEGVVADFPRTQVTERDGLYLAAGFTSLVFRFTDTVQFEVDPDAGLIHFRSDSVPYAGSDLGANRKRMTKVTTMLRERLAA